MAQEIVTWCDLHMKHGERVPALTLTADVDGSGPTQVDLCETHFKEIVAPLADLLCEGRPIKKPKKSGPQPTASLRQGGRGGRRATVVDPNPDSDLGERQVLCPICEAQGEEVRMVRGSMRDHFRHQHDTTLAEVESKQGRTLEGLELRFQCDVCQLGFSHAQGMGAHKRSVHGVVGAYSKDEDQGALVE